jgi:3-isopropylmalate/(R)-2-methylmalate dehydratase large subunit
MPSGQTQLFIGLHLIHEVTSPQAFQMIRERGLPVRFPDRTFATVDHIVPTDQIERPYRDDLAEAMMVEIERNTAATNVRFFGPKSGNQGIVHVIGPELGLTQPGMTVACGDSHTSTHGAFGALAFGIGTSQVRDVLATQTMSLAPLKVRRVQVDGSLGFGVTAKDVVLWIIAKLGVNGGTGFAYEYAGKVFDAMTMEERMTVCNMAIEGGARIGYVNPDDTTFAYLKGRPFAPTGEAWDRAVAWWRGLASDPGAPYDDVVVYDGATIEPMVTWGINPGHAIPVSGRVPKPAEVSDAEREGVELALRHMQFTAGQPIAGTKIDVAFIGSCTNSRLSDLRAAAEIVKGQKKSAHVKAIVVPGSEAVARDAIAEGLDEVFRAAGFEWREPGCSMCLAMNPDKLEGDQISASSSNRNFIGRQGSPSGRTLLMSPQGVAAAAIAGEVTDVRQFLTNKGAA